MPEKSFGDSCRTSDDCLTSENLKCSMRKCVCINKIVDGKCIKNNDKKYEEKCDHEGLPCKEEFSICSKGVCRCKQGYKMKNNQCVLCKFF